MIRKQVEHEVSTVQDCQNGISVDLFLHLSLIPAVLIVGVLSFLQRRAQKLAIDHRLPFLGGRFGIVVPLDTIGSLSNRWSYGFAFGAVSSSVLLLFSERYIPFTVPPWARAIVYLVGALEVGLVYFPFFACLSTPFRTAGAMLGILYSLSWIIITVWDTFTCPGGKILGKHQKIIVQWPCILSLIFLLGRFIYILIKAVRIHLQLEQEDPEELNEQHQIQHVKRLLRKTPTHSKPLSWFQRRVYESDPYFKFPNRIIGTAIISLIGIYTMTLADYSLSNVAFDQVEKWKNTLQQMITTCNQTEALGVMIPQLEEFIVVARKSWLATTIFASLNSVAYTFHVLVCYRKHMKRLWKGQRGFLPEKFHNPNSAVSVASIARYSGWQIAFTLWGYLIIHFVQFQFALLLVYGLVLPIQHGKALSMLTSLGIIVLTICLVISLVILQIVLVQIFFLQDKMSPTDKQKPLALNNRKAFHCFNYFFFFYNVVMGISSCIMRLLFSLVVGTWLVSRIDRTIMQRGYETLDTGYSTWIGMIFADHYHNNPVAVCFCQLLVSSKMERHMMSAYSTFSNMPPDPPVNSQAKRRWMLFYTLLRNPHLILRRKHHLSSSSCPQSDMVVRACVMVSQTQSCQEAPQSLPEITVTPAEDC
ncbi:STRA6-like [Toxotes jaculatrix]|uniref:STRA6-like n=1 Tax=Toxotes jaculatrix TaxID=941984 RepID=UPI001B3AEDCC|nr:STRA6-like [Toxotes jaculatrix]